MTGPFLLFEVLDEIPEICDLFGRAGMLASQLAGATFATGRLPENER